MFEHAIGGLIAIAGGGLNIDLDITLFFQMALFIFLWVFLTSTVFRPYLAARREREQRTDGTKAEAAMLRHEVESRMKGLEEQLAEARGVASTRRQALVKSGSTEGDVLVSKARGESSVTLESARAGLADEVAMAQKSMAPHAQGLSVAITERILA